MKRTKVLSLLMVAATVTSMGPAVADNPTTPDGGSPLGPYVDDLMDIVAGTGNSNCSATTRKTQVHPGFRIGEALDPYVDMPSWSWRFHYCWTYDPWGDRIMDSWYFKDEPDAGESGYWEYTGTTEDLIDDEYYCVQFQYTAHFDFMGGLDTWDPTTGDQRVCA